jgi:hypothetical protein
MLMSSVVLQSLATANLFPSSLIPFTLMMEAIRFSETLVLTRVTRRHIPEDGILHNLKPFMSIILNK